MNIEVIRIRNDRGDSIQVDGNIKRLDSNDLLDRVCNLNKSMDNFSNLNGNPEATIDDYAKHAAEIISLVLGMFSEMGIYPDYFYDIYFRINDDFRSLQSAGEVGGDKDLYDVPGYRFRISKLMENGVNNGNYKLNPTKVKGISDYYNKMVAFSQKHYMPCNVNTIEMCREMLLDIKTRCENCINSLGTSPYVSDDIEKLTIILFEVISFFAAIGVNPKEYLDVELEKLDEKHNSK